MTVESRDDYYKNWRSLKAKWIWIRGDPRPRNTYVQFRKILQLARAPKNALVHVSADCRYVLYVNGTVAGRGPLPTHTRYKQVDVYDVGSLMRRGENVVAALVLQRHEHCSRLYPARGGFILELNTDQQVFGTDNTWRARRAVEYRSDVPWMTFQYGLQEWVDGRCIPVGWEMCGFDDSTWQTAVHVRKPFDVWPEDLELRTVPYMRYETVHPSQLVCYFGIASRHTLQEDEGREPARAMMSAYLMSTAIAVDPDNLICTGRGPAKFSIKVPGGGNGIGVVVDLGDELLGYPFIDIECGAGAIVNIGHGEVLSRNRVPVILREDGGLAEQRYADRYITRSGRQRFAINDTKGCRYLEIHFTHLDASGSEPEITIHEIGMIRSEGEFERVSELACSDPLLDRTWAICRRTCEVLCQDWLICDAQREQNQWPVLFQEMQLYTCFGGLESVRQMLHTFCRLQLSDGFFLSSFPIIEDKDVEKATGEDTYFLSSLKVPLIVYLDWLYGGEDDRHAFWLNCCNTMFESLCQLIGPYGTIQNTPGTAWMEWSAADIRGPRQTERSSELTFINAFAVLGMESAAKMAAAYGLEDFASRWRRRAAEIRRASNRRFWSASRGAYVDGVYDDRPSDVISQSTNACAVMAGLGNARRLRRAMETCETPGDFDVPSHFSMMQLYHEARQTMGMDGMIALGEIRDLWGYMIDHDAKTSWEDRGALEMHNGLCLPFACAITYLARTVLGITPLDAGHRRFSVCVLPHDLKWAKGRIATPSGYIEVAWRLRQTHFALSLTVPKGCEAVVAAPRIQGEKEFAPSRPRNAHLVLASHEIATCTFLREKRPTYLLGPGKHTLEYTNETGGC